MGKVKLRERTSEKEVDAPWRMERSSGARQPLIEGIRLPPFGVRQRHIIGVTLPYTVERSLPPLSRLDVVYCAGEEVSVGASRTSQLKVVCHAVCDYGETLQRQHKEVCMSSRRRPPKVQPGMTIGIVTPSSPVRDRL